MSFSILRKRSRSQSSGSNNDDDCHSMRSDRKDLNEKSLIERRYSGVSERSSRPADYGLDDSCVVRNFPKHKSSHLRFLAWVAYTRKYADRSITDDERRTCPLLWCREIFSDEEAMLKHVWECENLSKGLYWCFHCQRPERVGKFQCKRCQGLPSKTDRLATVAKRIFSKLGTKYHRDECPIPNSEARTGTTLSKVPESTKLDQFPESHDSFEQDEFPPYEPLPELPNNCISEMENTSIVPEMDTTWNMSPQEVQDPNESGKESSDLSAGLYSSMVMDPADHAFSASNPPWSPSSFEAPIPTQRSGRTVPALALNTRDIYQPPSSRHRHGRIGTLSDEPMSATVISPLSATEDFFSSILGMPGYEVSPTNSEATCNSFLTHDSGYTSATIDSATSMSMDYDRIWDSHDSMKKSNPDVFSMTSRLEMGGQAGLMQPPSLPASANSSQLPSRSSSNSSSHSANRCTAIVKRKELSQHWKDSKSLVESFVEVLNEHLEHSRKALNQLPSNSTIKELLAMSSSSIISVGFNALRGLLEKRNPTAIIEIYAFSHVAYAAAITIDDQSSKVRSEEWFQDSLSWLSGLSSERQRMSYTLIVQAIWKPRDLTEMGDFLDFSKLTELSQRSTDHENSLVKTCRHFLDIQENLCNNERSSNSSISTAFSFNFSQASFSRRAKSRIIDELIQKTSIEAFIEDVVAVEQRMQNGAIKDLRQLELELICAGKLASQSDSIYETFMSHVTCLCDTLYSEGESDKSRNEYQIEDIDVTKSLISEDGFRDEDVNETFDFTDLLDEQSSSSHLPSHSSFEAFLSEANSVLDDSPSVMKSAQTQLLSQPTSLARSRSDPTTPINPFRRSRLPTPSSSAIPTRSPFPPPTSTPFSASKSALLQSTATLSSSSSSSSKNKYKCHCGYIPNGEEKWKPSNLARHKRTQHPVEVKVYKCRFPGCASTFTRSDNLRSHARDKGHDVAGSAKEWNGLEEKRSRGDGEGVDGGRQRPSKRRKVLGNTKDALGVGEEKGLGDGDYELDLDSIV